jgi:hypothetical protein
MKGNEKAKLLILIPLALFELIIIGMIVHIFI